MSTSSPTSPAHSSSSSFTTRFTRKVALESGVAAVLATGAAALMGGTDIWLDQSAVHPGWVAVLAMASFYGLVGLAVATPVVWLFTALLALPMGAGLAGAERLLQASDLLFFGSALGVAGIAMVHHRQRQRLEHEVAELREQHREDSELLDGLQERLLADRARNERIDFSVRFWREAAEKLESMSAKDAARAALELGITRTGARAGIVRLVDDKGMRNLAWRGRWSAERQIPRDIFSDTTISAAVDSGLAVLASDLPDATAEDSDIAVAIHHPETKEVMGVIALRGAKRSQLGQAELEDLCAIADWMKASMVAEHAEHAEHGTRDTHAASGDSPSSGIDTSYRLRVIKGGK